METKEEHLEYIEKKRTKSLSEWDKLYGKNGTVFDFELNKLKERNKIA